MTRQSRDSGFACFASLLGMTIDSPPSIRLRRRVGGADLPESQQAAGVFERQFAVLLFGFRQFMAAHACPRRSGCRARRRRFPSSIRRRGRGSARRRRAGSASPGGSPRCSSRIVRRGLRPSRRISALWQSQQLRLVELAVLGKRCDEAARRAAKSRVRDISRLAPAAAAAIALADFLEQMRRRARQQPRAHGLGGAAQQLLAQLGRQVDANAGFDRQMQDRSPPASARWHSRSPTSARRDW